VQINAIFRRVGSRRCGQATGGRSQEALAGATTGVMVMRSALGYTGDQPRMQIMQLQGFHRRQGRDLPEEGSQTRAKLGNSIERQLLTQ
jgi:hypothetical protein